jgi:hypothetical protein
MTIAIDLDTHLASNLTALAQQGVANTNNFAHYANLAFTKDLMQSGQESNAGILAGLNAADRTPVIKTATS